MLARILHMSRTHTYGFIAALAVLVAGAFIACVGCADLSCETRSAHHELPAASSTQMARIAHVEADVLPPSISFGSPAIALEPGSAEHERDFVRSVEVALRV